MTPTKIIFNGELHMADELTFEPLRDQWQEFRLEDGTLLRVKFVLAKVVRLRDLKTPAGQPVYSTESQNVVTATTRPGFEDCVLRAFVQGHRTPEMDLPLAVVAGEQ